MTRVYENRGYWWRQSASLAILIVVGVWGVWELWTAATSPPGQTGIGLLLGVGDDRYFFGAAFVLGAAYGLWQLIRDAADLVSTFDMDETTRTSEVTLWRPFWTERLKGDPGRVGNWRFHVRIGKRNARTFYVYAEHPDYPRPLQFDLRHGTNVDGLRKVAPEAIADFERSVGIRT